MNYVYLIKYTLKGVVFPESFDLPFVSISRSVLQGKRIFSISSDRVRE